MPVWVRALRRKYSLSHSTWARSARLGSNIAFVFLKYRLKCLLSALCPCSALTLFGVNGTSRKGSLLSRIAVGWMGRGAIAACLPPFNLMLNYCREKAVRMPCIIILGSHPLARSSFWCNLSALGKLLFWAVVVLARGSFSVQ